MTREEYFSKLDEEHAFLYFHLKPMDEERHNKWINHIFYIIKQSAGKIFNDFDAQLKSKDEEIKRLKEKIHRLENDSIVLNMEQRLIDIGLVLDGKLTSKDTK